MSRPAKTITALEAWFRTVGHHRLCKADPRLLPLYELAVGRALVRDGKPIGVGLAPHGDRAWFLPLDLVPEDCDAPTLEPDTALTTSHVFDWLVADLGDDAPWLSRTDRDGRPLKLVKIGSLERACREADKAMRRRLAAAPKVVLDPESEETHAELADGWSLVRLKTPEALDLESSLMQHCIGQGAYDDQLASGKRLYLSLRDPQGRPHATLEIGTEDRSLLQFQGKQNGRPIRRYGEIARPWLRENVALGSGFGHPNAHTWWSGLVEDVAGNIHEETDLPDELEVGHGLGLDLSRAKLPSTSIVSRDGILEIAADGSYAMPTTIGAKSLFLEGGSPVFGETSDVRAETVRLIGTKIECLPVSDGGPRNLRVLGGSSVDALPIGTGTRVVEIQDSTVGAIPSAGELESLRISDSTVGSIAPGLVVGRLELLDARIGRLPAGTTVYEELTLGTSDLTELPEDLSLVGDLVLAGASDFEGRPFELPENLSIGRRLTVRSWPGGMLPDGLTVGSSADLAHYEGGLPARLRVEGNLTVDGRHVKHLPSDLVVGCDIFYLVDDGLPTIGENTTIGGRILVVWEDGERERVDPIPSSDLTVVPDEAPAPSM